MLVFRIDREKECDLMQRGKRSCRFEWEKRVVSIFQDFSVHIGRDKTRRSDAVVLLGTL